MYWNDTILSFLCSVAQLLTAAMAPPSVVADECQELQRLHEPHAVVVPWPGQGHINPLLHFARHLVARAGFRITFVNLRYTHEHMVRSRRLAASDQKSNEDGSSNLPDVENMNMFEEAGGMIRFVWLPDGLSVERTRTSDVPELSHALDGTEAGLERLIAEAQPPVTCIVSDSFAMHTQDVANRLGLPRLAFWTQSAASYAVHFMVATGLLRRTSDTGEIEGLCSDMPSLPPRLQLHDIPTFLQPFDPSDYMFHFVTRPFLRAHEATLVVLPTFDELEGELMATIQKLEPPHRINGQVMHPAPRLHTVGPVQLLDKYYLDESMNPSSSSLWQEDYSCLEWLDRQRPSSVVYVAFGSITLLSETQLHELALGLEDCGRPFLWVLRPGTLASGGAQDSDLEAILPKGYMGRVQGRALLIAWAPQVRVLTHPAVGGFLTHGGWNSTIEGIASGLPLLGFSYFADQMLNCRCAADVWRNGLSFDTSEVTSRPLSRSDVAAKVAAIMEDPHMRERALHLQHAANRAVAPGGSSFANLDVAIVALRGQTYYGEKLSQGQSNGYNR